jgi:hypothetical protein
MDGGNIKISRQRILDETRLWRCACVHQRAPLDIGKYQAC